MGVGGAKDISIWSKNNALCSIIIFTFCTQILAIVVMYLLGGSGKCSQIIYIWCKLHFKNSINVNL